MLTSICTPDILHLICFKICLWMAKISPIKIKMREKREKYLNQLLETNWFFSVLVVEKVCSSIDSTVQSIFPQTESNKLEIH